MGLSGIAQLFHKYGFAGMFIKFIEKRNNPTDRYYREHYKEFLPTEDELVKQRYNAATFAEQPLISIVVPTYRTKENYLVELLDSVLAQTYGKWELILADGSGDDSVRQVVRQYLAAHEGESRIICHPLASNGGISANTNAGLALAKGEYIGLLDHDDLLEANALYAMVAEINGRLGQGKPKPMLLYSDEDKISEDGKVYSLPHFKTDFSEELLNHYNYICHFLVFHRDMLQYGMLNSEFDGAQDHDLVLRYTEQLAFDQIAHVPHILYHWRISNTSTAGRAWSKDYAAEASARAVEQHQERLKATLTEEKPDYIILLGDGVIPLDLEWDQELCQFLTNHRYPIGMVGGRITDGPGNLSKVVSCGYSRKTDGSIVADFAGLRACKRGYFDRAFYPHNVMACSMDFAIVRKDVFEQVGGLDEHLSAQERDIDFGQKVLDAGYGILVDPTVTAYRKRK